MLTQSTINQFERDGYVVVPKLFSLGDVSKYIEHFMSLRAQGDFPGDFSGCDLTSTDPLKRFPRMIHMHRTDKVSRDWLLHPVLCTCLTELLTIEPYAVQTMLYFKPPGARGQALHQDQFYLRVQPGTCIAAWMALDNCDEENGCLQVIPGSHSLPLLCTATADTSTSFTDVTVPVPVGTKPVPVIMEAGDVLFFTGNLIHGSYPNTTHDRFRRSLIGHYITGNASKVGGYYHPVLQMDGSEVKMAESLGDGPCGVWRDISDFSAGIDMIVPNKTSVLLHE